MRRSLSTCSVTSQGYELSRRVSATATSRWSSTSISRRSCASRLVVEVILEPVVIRGCPETYTSSEADLDQGLCASEPAAHTRLRRPVDGFVVRAGVEQGRGRDGTIEAVGRRDRGGRGRLARSCSSPWEVRQIPRPRRGCPRHSRRGALRTARMRPKKPPASTSGRGYGSAFQKSGPSPGDWFAETQPKISEVQSLAVFT